MRASFFSREDRMPSPLVAIEKHFHAVIMERAGELVREHNLELPKLDALAAAAHPSRLLSTRRCQTSARSVPRPQGQASATAPPPPHVGSFPLHPSTDPLRPPRSAARPRLASVRCHGSEP